MNRPTTRLLTLLELLQSRGRLSGAELAKRLEVDGRSVRRYIMMLQDLGIPIEGTRGPYGGYRLMPGYKMPPLLFTQDEAVALTLGLLSLQHAGLALTPEAIEGALAKIERVLPAAGREQLWALQTHLALESEPQDRAADSALVMQLSAASARGRRVRLLYRNLDGQKTDRLIDPYGVVSWARSWYLVGYCHLRQDLRVFRVDRVESLAVQEQRFNAPADFDFLGYVLRRVAGWGSAYDVEVVLGLSLDAARRKVPPVETELEETPDGVVLRTHATDLGGFARFLLGLACQLTVRRPYELKEALRQAAQEIMQVAEQA